MCVECVDFWKLPSSFIKPGVFVYRPAHKADIVVAGYLRDMRRDIGGADVLALCVRFLRAATYDGWRYPLLRFEKDGRDVSINGLNNRVQFRAASSRSWRSVFAMRAVDGVMRAEYRLVAVGDVKELVLGLVPAALAGQGNVRQALCAMDCDEAMTYRCAAEQGDEIVMRADLKAGCVEFEINGYEVKKVDVQVAAADSFRFGVSLCRQYEAVELVECVLSE